MQTYAFIILFPSFSYLSDIMPHKRADEKPHPDIFIKAAETLKCPASQCVVIEDALKGLNASKAAKMRCIIIRNEQNRNIDFSEADLVISSLAQFATLLEF